MKAVIISDIHSNLEALKGFSDAIQDIDLDAIFCLGDVVGYGADPIRCMEFIRSCEIPCCLGNHDLAAIDISSAFRFNPIAQIAAQWTEQQLSKDMKEFMLRKMKQSITIGSNVTMVHGFPGKDRFAYTDSRHKAFLAMHEIGDGVDHTLIVGHTHEPGIIRIFETENDEVNSYDAEDVQYQEKIPYRLNDNNFHVINVGSIGQPRDGDPRGCFVVWDSENRTVEFNRFEYDIELAQKKIIDAGLPEGLARRLSEGL